MPLYEDEENLLGDAEEEISYVSGSKLIMLLEKLEEELSDDEKVLLLS